MVCASEIPECLQILPSLIRASNVSVVFSSEPGFSRLFLTRFWTPPPLEIRPPAVVTDVRNISRFELSSEVTCCLELSHVGWVVFTRELLVSTVLAVAGLSSTAWGCWSWSESGGAFREAWRFVMRGMMLLLALPSPGTLESPEIITWDTSGWLGCINDRLKFCKHFSKLIFCRPDWLGCIFYERSMTSSSCQSFKNL